MPPGCVGRFAFWQYIVLEVANLRSHTAWSILPAALIWAVAGTCVAAAICFPFIFFYAFFVIVDAAPGALVLGMIAAAWLYVEKAKAANSREFIRFGLVSGCGLGMLALPRALARADVSFVSWHAPAVFFLAALVGGGVGGICSAASYRIGTSTRQASGSITRLVVGCCLILVPLGVAEYFHYGEVVQAKLRVLGYLSKDSVTNLPAGNAQGARWTGCYAWNYHNIGESGVGGGQIQVHHVDGRLTIVDAKTLDGGIGSNGRFWAGSDTTFSDDELRILWKGKFVNEERAEFSIHTTVLKNGAFLNSVIAEGTADRIPCR